MSGMLIVVFFLDACFGEKYNTVCLTHDLGLSCDTRYERLYS